MKLLTYMAEKGWLPDTVIRMGTRRLLAQRLRQCEKETSPFDIDRIEPIAVDTSAANAQHYEVDPGFFRAVLGPRQKYSCCWYENAETSLSEAEELMLAQTCSRAGLEDGMEILELGCGWGSLTLWMAEHYPNSKILAISNSHNQRATIEALLHAKGLKNVRVKTIDINRFLPQQRFDRVLSVEMFEHVRNHVLLLERVAQWLHEDGKLFVHVFCHRQYRYAYEVRDESDWMARHFFTGGMMPSYDYFRSLPIPFTEESSWVVGGNHYARTSRDWLKQLDARRDQIAPLFRNAGVTPSVALQRWRIFFMACEELFAYNDGNEWHVGHYLMSPVNVGADARESHVQSGATP